VQSLLHNKALRPWSQSNWVFTNIQAHGLIMNVTLHLPTCKACKPTWWQAADTSTIVTCKHLRYPCAGYHPGPLR
jgi:hypothetical protein